MRSRSEWSVAVFGLAGLLVVGSAAYVAYEQRLRPWLEQRDCRAGAGALAPCLHEGLIEGPQGARYHPDRPDPACASGRWRCAACDGPFVYRAVPPSAERLRFDVPDAPYRLLAWCPQPCHGGRRVWLTASLEVRLGRDDEMGWYHQKRADRLTEHERTIENEYRQAHDLPMLD